MLGPILLQIILILLNAVFSCAEVAVLSLNPARLKMLAQEGDLRAQRLEKL